MNLFGGFVMQLLRLFSPLLVVVSLGATSPFASSNPSFTSSLSSKPSDSLLKAPSPIFPMGVWKDYIQTHNYKELPGLIGFSPLIDPATGNVKTSPVTSDQYGVNVPLVLRCDDPSGCRGYKVSANPARLSIEYLDRTALLFFKTNALNTIEIPPDSAGHKGILVDVRKKYPSANISGQLTCTEDLMCYGGRGENDGNEGSKKLHYDLITPYKGVIAILYLDKNKLTDSTPMDSDGPLLFESWSNGQRDFNFNFPGLRVVGEPYLMNGYVWKLTDYGYTAPHTEWKRIETFASGVTDTTALSLSVEVGMKVGYGSGGPGFSAEVSTTMTTTWGQEWSMSKDHTVQTEMTCNNIDGRVSVLCGVYQKYGSTKLIVPGFEDNNYYFNLFNQDSRVKNHWVSLNVGLTGSENRTDDTGEVLGTIYPIAGTLEPEGNLSNAQPTLEMPE